MLNLSSSHVDYIWLEGREKKRLPITIFAGRITCIHSPSKQSVWYLIGLYFVLFAFVRLFVSAAAVKRGSPLPKSLANTKGKSLTVAIKRRIARRLKFEQLPRQLGEEAKTLVASGQRRPLRRRDGVKICMIFFSVSPLILLAGQQQRLHF